ncbi:MAG: glycoside hydrolase family 97 N-terminal domain-containing protein, partial [Ignavibacteriaceae bacterium]|nr:glycoside hydrolase family 97 N-terminal domain-containing protein [Ignavibacteriaceae bacterium]
MKKNFIYLKTIVVLIVILLFHSCGNGNNETELLSPDGKIKLIFYLSGEGKAGYLINYSDNKIIDTSYFSFDFQDQESFGKNLEIVNIFTSSFDQTWQTVWGEQ